MPEGSALAAVGGRAQGSPGPGDWEQLARSSGLYDSRAPLPPGDTGFSSYLLQPLQVLSFYPRIVVYPNFIDPQRAEAIKRAAEGRLARSVVQLRKTDNAQEQSGVRTSSGTFLKPEVDPSGAIAWLDERIAQVTGIPTSHFEPFNVLRYALTEHYDSHYDRFDPKEYGTQPSNRIATVITYLEAPEEGGETIFPLEGEKGEANMQVRVHACPFRWRGSAGRSAHALCDCNAAGHVRSAVCVQNFNYKTCDRGLIYRPRPGDAILFWSVRPDNSRDVHSLHGGCPVIKGTKWVATKWIRDQPLR